MPRRSTKRYYKVCIVCEREFYSSRKDAQTCSPVCRKQHERNRAYVPEQVRRIRGDLAHLIDLVESPEYSAQAWQGLIALGSFIARAVCDRAMVGFELGQESFTDKDGTNEN